MLNDKIIFFLFIITVSNEDNGHLLRYTVEET